MAICFELQNKCLISHSYMYMKVRIFFTMYNCGLLYVHVQIECLDAGIDKTRIIVYRGIHGIGTNIICNIIGLALYKTPILVHRRTYSR